MFWRKSCSLFPSPALANRKHSGAYRAAFLTCRKHRLDLNLLYDLDPEKFMANLETFVENVHEVDYLNLFISSLKQVCSLNLWDDENDR